MKLKTPFAVVALIACAATFAGLRITKRAHRAGPDTITVEANVAHASNSSYMFGQCKALGQWSSIATLNLDGQAYVPEFYRDGTVFLGATTCAIDTGEVYVLTHRLGFSAPLIWAKVNTVTQMIWEP